MTYKPVPDRRIALDGYDATVWSMDNVASPLISSGFNLPISLINNGGIFGATGLFDTSILFNGSASLSSVNSTVEPTAISFTYSCWVFLKDYGSGSPIIVSKSYHTTGEGWGSPFGIGINLSSSSDGYWDVGNSNTASLHLTDKIELNRWQHLAFTWDGFWIRAYLNSSEVGADHTNMTGTPLAFDFGTHGPWLIGGNAMTSGDYFHGYIDDVRICNIARSHKYLERQYRWGIGQFDDDSIKPFKFFTDFSTLSLGGQDNSLFLTHTGLNFSRSSSATVQIGKEKININVSSDHPRIGDIGAVWGRALSFEESRENFALGARTIPTNWTSSGSGVSYSAAPSMDGGNNAVRVQLSGNGDFSAYQDTAASTNMPTFYSGWMKSASSNNKFDMVVGNAASSADATSLQALPYWQKVEIQGIHNNLNNIIRPVSTEYSGVNIVDVVVDFMQVEAGFFPTESIITTSAAITRAGERLYLNDAGHAIDAETLNCYYKIIPKGNISDYTFNPRLWTLDSSNYCEIDIPTQSIKTVVQDQIWLTDVAINWQKLDVLEIFVSVGGNVPGRAVYRINGGNPIQLGNSDINISPVVNLGNLDILCNNTTQQFTSWVKLVSFWKAGQNPSWARLPPPFFPTSLHDLQLWLVSSLGVSLNTGNVEDWADQSGNTNDFTSANSGVRPVFLSSGIAARPDMFYDGTKTLNGAETLNPLNITVFGIFSTSHNSAGSMTIIGKGNTQSNFIVDLNNQGYSFFNGLGGDSGQSDFSLNDGLPHTFVSVFDNTTKTFRQYIDGIKQLNTGTTIFDLLSILYPVSIGSQTDDGYTLANSFTGDVPEVGIYDRALSPEEIDQLNKYLLKKAGIIKQFRPDNLPGLQLWFRDDFKITEVSSNVSVWGDLSTHGRDLIQPTSGIRPIYGVDSNSKLTGLQFGGSEYLYWDNTDVAISAVVAFTIFKSGGIVNLSQLFGKAFAGLDWALNGINGGGEETIGFNIGNFGNTAKGDVRLDDGLSHTAVGVWDNASQVISLYVDGQLQYHTDTFSGTLSGIDTVAVGAQVDSTVSSANAFFQGSVIEAGLYSIPFTKTNLNSLQQYLNKRAPNLARSPQEISGLNSWFRSTLRLSEASNLVSEWQDITELNILPTLSQSNNSLKPIFHATAINHLPSLHGDGSRALVGNTTLLGTSQITLFAIVKSASSSLSSIWGMGYSQNCYKIKMLSNGFVLAFVNSGSTVLSDAALNDDNPHLIILTWDSQSDGKILLYIDGLLQAASTIDTDPIIGIGESNAILAGAVNESVINEQFDGYVPEIGSYNRKITAKEAVALSHYLAYRANISIIETPVIIPGASDIFRADINTTLGGLEANSVASFDSIVSANIFELAQSDTGQRPLLNSPGLNSFDDISFNGASSLYSFIGSIGTGDPTQLSMYIIFNTTDSSSLATMAGMHGNNPHYSFDLASGILQANINGQITSSDAVVNDGYTHWAVLTWNSMASGGLIKLYVDGIPNTSSQGLSTSSLTDGVSDGDRHAIGAGIGDAGATAVNYYTGIISEHGTFSTQLVNFDLNNLFSYLRTRSGVQ